MATGRALTTETERESFRGEQGDQRMSDTVVRQASNTGRTCPRRRLFEDDHPELLKELLEVVCEGE